MFKSDVSNETFDDPPFDVLVHGLISVEYLLHLDRIPLPGDACVIKREWRGTGGAGVNCAMALASWGARVCLMGNPLGTDSNGRLIARELQAHPNLTVRTPLLDDFETPYSVILAVEHTPHAVLVRHQAAVDHDRQDGEHGDASAGIESWPAARIATIDGHFPLSSRRLVRHLRQRGTPLFARGTLLNESVLNESVAPLAEVVLLIPASPPRSEQDLMKLACERADEWGNVAVILQSDGSSVWCRAGSDAQRSAPVKVGNVHTAGDTGAADVFRAGLIWARLHDWNWERGLRFATVAASLKTAAVGVMQAVPRVDEIETVLS